jgi:hypothetical protein
MITCLHRVNSLDLLQATPASLGVEVDIRSNGKDLYVSHDAFEDGINFELWLESFNHKFLIANVKEEGLEDKLRSLFSRKGIQNWAFLDQTFPFLVKELRNGLTKTMVRISEFENSSISSAFDVKPEWIWLDSFTGRYPSSKILADLNSSGFKIMIVSPELQGRKPELEILQIKELFFDSQIEIDGVCTKFPEMWE